MFFTTGKNFGGGSKNVNWLRYGGVVQMHCAFGTVSLYRTVFSGVILHLCVEFFCSAVSVK